MKRTKHIVRLLVIAVLTVAMTLNMSSCGLMLLTAGGTILGSVLVGNAVLEEVFADDGAIFHEHEFGTWQAVAEATCTENGKQTRSCLTCDYEEEEILYATGHSIDHGACKNCHMITDAYDALAYFVRTNGSLSDDGKIYTIVEIRRGEDYTMYYGVQTNLDATTLRFVSLHETTSGSTVLLIMNIEKGQSKHDVTLNYESLTNEYKAICSIYSDRFSSSNRAIYSFNYDAPSYVEDNIKNLMEIEIDLMLVAIDEYILDDYNTGITMPMLGFSNY